MLEGFESLGVRAGVVDVPSLIFAGIPEFAGCMLEGVTELVSPTALFEGAGIEQIDGAGKALVAIDDDEIQGIAFQAPLVEFREEELPGGL